MKNFKEITEILHNMQLNIKNMQLEVQQLSLILSNEGEIYNEEN